MQNKEFYCERCRNVFPDQVSMIRHACEIPKTDIKNQKHYTQFKIQPIVFIEENKLGWCAGNVVKYVCRYADKNGIEDLKKAQHYLEVLIRKVETGEVKP